MRSVESGHATGMAYPEAAKRAGFGETKFRELIAAGEIGFIENGDRKLISDEEIRRLHRAKLKFATAA